MGPPAQLHYIIKINHNFHTDIDPRQVLLQGHRLLRGQLCDELPRVSRPARHRQPRRRLPQLRLHRQELRRRRIRRPRLDCQHDGCVGGTDLL